MDDPRHRPLATPTLQLLADLIIELAPPQHVGDTGMGTRIHYSVTGGHFAGPRLHGEILPGGGDWAVFRADGNMHADVRMTLRTADDALLHLAYQGRWVIPPAARAAVADPAQRSTLDPQDYYFRTAPLFETGAKQYAWLNDIVCLGSGYPIEGGVGYRIFQAD